MRSEWSTRRRPVAPIVVPGATVVPGAATPSNVPPPDYPQNLEAAPQATPGQAPVRRLPSSTGRHGQHQVQFELRNLSSRYAIEQFSWR